MLIICTITVVEANEEYEMLTRIEVIVKENCNINSHKVNKKENYYVEHMQGVGDDNIIYNYKK